MGVSVKELRLQNQQRTYINVMESLVAQEIGQQLQHLPTRVRHYIKVEEVVTYALNRLPPLYASSERGWEHQRQLAKRDLQGKIADAVRQAIAAVQVDPLRLSKPILRPQTQATDAVLMALRSLFQVPDLDWSTALEKLRALEQNTKAATASSAPHHSSSGLPGTYDSGGVPWPQRRPQRRSLRANSAQYTRKSGLSPAMGWDDPRYCL
ncbi:MAG: late competence development ComFB family protein [Leptolyngbyaceae cyanobacterium]